MGIVQVTGILTLLEPLIGTIKQKALGGKKIEDLTN
jgi:hypothetical protein